nr:GvpL/GvpF family gas vesicle protein [Brevibacterium daeguense]
MYVYAIVPAELIGEQLGTGIDDAPVTVVGTPGGIAAAVHEHDTTPIQGPDDEVKRWVLEHSRVVDAAWERAGTALPVSFNVIVSPQGALTAHERLTSWLGDSESALRSHLERLRGRVELRAEISLDQKTVSESSPEVREMRQSVAERPAGVQRLYRKRLETFEREITEKLADRLYPDYRRRLAALSEDLTENRRPGRTPGSVAVLSVSLLVPEENMEQVGIALAEIRDEQPGTEIRYLGPWPPYSFAEVPEPASPGAEAPAPAE